MGAENVRKHIPVLFVLSLLIITMGMLYLFLQSSELKTDYFEGRAGIDSLQRAEAMSNAAVFFLFVIVVSFIVYILTTLRFFGKNVPSMISGNSDAQIGITFSLFFIFYVIVLFLTSLGGTQSVIELPAQSVFSQASTALQSDFWILQLKGFNAPLAEEWFFVLVMPTLLFFVSLSLIKLFKLPFPIFFSIGATMVGTALAFSYFHVFNQGNPWFLIISILFRSIILGLIYTNYYLKLVPVLHLGIGVGFGMHIANNLFGVARELGMNAFDVIATLLFIGDGSPLSIFVGWLTLLLFVTSFGFLFSAFTSKGGVRSWSS